MVGSIRPATVDDAPRLEIVRQQAIEAGFTDVYDRSQIADRIADRDDWLREWVDDPTVLVRLAETDVSPIGYGAFDRSACRLLALYTAPAYQRRGVASSLLEQFVCVARRIDCDRIRATVPLNAIGFLEHHEFERHEETTADGIAVVRMTKALDR